MAECYPEKSSWCRNEQWVNCYALWAVWYNRYCAIQEHTLLHLTIDTHIHAHTKDNIWKGRHTQKQYYYIWKLKLRHRFRKDICTATYWRGYSFREKHRLFSAYQGVALPQHVAMASNNLMWRTKVALLLWTCVLRWFSGNSNIPYNPTFLQWISVCMYGEHRALETLKETRMSNVEYYELTWGMSSEGSHTLKNEFKKRNSRILSCHALSVAKETIVVMAQSCWMTHCRGTLVRRATSSL